MIHKRLFFAASAFAAAIFLMTQTPAPAQTAAFGPENPFYAPSSLPFHAPPFNHIQDSDYQPAIEAGMAQQEKEILAIADNPAPPTFENTFVAMEKTGQLLHRAQAAFDCVTGANTDPVSAECAAGAGSEAGRALRLDLPERETVRAGQGDL